MLLLILGLSFLKHGVISLKYPTGIGVSTVVHLGYFYGLFGGSYAISFFDYGAGLGYKWDRFGVSVRFHYFDYITGTEDYRVGAEVSFTGPLFHRANLFWEVGALYAGNLHSFLSSGKLYPNLGIIYAPYLGGD